MYKENGETDERGWVYGFTFGLLLSQMKENKASTSALGNHVRRRKWTRKAKALSEETITTSSLPASNFAAVNALTRKSVSADQEFWRETIAKEHKNVVFANCQERQFPNDAIVIPWNQVLSLYSVTDSVLSIHVLINRYFSIEGARKVQAKDMFRPAELEIFVSNCSSHRLQSLIDERKWFNRVRVVMKDLVASGTLYGSRKDLSEEKELSTTAIPETEELSVGSELLADIDHEANVLEETILEMENLYAKRADLGIAVENAILVRRACRLRLYAAGLLGAGLRSETSFHKEDAAIAMQSDFDRCRLIELDNDVSTANNRIEYLIDAAEKRIRDTALTGWTHREGGLKECLECFVNGYFIEIAGLLGMFFEHSRLSSVKVIFLANYFLIQSDCNLLFSRD